MGFIIGFLTFIMVLDCLLLILLVLLQLPKKEAGAGVAFGGAATDALFGAGSGTVLTKITKYAATFFFVMAVFLSILQSKHYHGSSAFLKGMMEGRPPAAPTGMPTAPATTPATKPPVPTAGSNALQSAPAEATNLPVQPATPTGTNAGSPK